MVNVSGNNASNENIPNLIEAIGKNVQKSKDDKVIALCENLFTKLNSLEQFLQDRDPNSLDSLQTLGVLTFYEKSLHKLPPETRQKIRDIAFNAGIYWDKKQDVSEKVDIQKMDLKLLDHLLSLGVGVREGWKYVEESMDTRSQNIDEHFSWQVIALLQKHSENLTQNQRREIFFMTNDILNRFYIEAEKIIQQPGHSDHRQAQLNKECCITFIDAIINPEWNEINPMLEDKKANYEQLRDNQLKSDELGREYNRRMDQTPPRLVIGMLSTFLELRSKACEDAAFKFAIDGLANNQFVEKGYFVEVLTVLAQHRCKLDEIKELIPQLESTFPGMAQLASLRSACNVITSKSARNRMDI